MGGTGLGEPPRFLGALAPALGGNPVLSVVALSMEGLFRISILCGLAGTGRNQACKWLK